MRVGAVGASAGDTDVEEIRARHHRTAVHRDLSLRPFGSVVERVDLVAREALEQPVRQHGARAAEPLLGGLEDEDDRAVESTGLGEVPGGAEQHGGVPIVAAAVEAPRVLGAIRQVGLLVHRQGVHVGPKPDAAFAGTTACEHADDAGLADASVNLDAPGGELLGHDAGGADLLEPDLRMRVQVAPDGSELVGEIGDAGKHGHSQLFKIGGRDQSVGRRRRAVKQRNEA